MSEHPPKNLDLNLESDDTIAVSLDTQKAEIDPATREAEQRERIAAAERVKAEDAVKLNEVQARLGIERFAEVFADEADVEAVGLETGRNEAMVKAFEEEQAAAPKETVPYTPNVVDLEDMRAIRDQKSKDMEEILALRRELAAKQVEGEEPRKAA